ncbi:MAG: Fe-S cluster assembly protein SufD [Candidatus Obscuribacterales bacterium]|nr:Fe-S cluster assembly protein SufD [Steroidobacteraceae bacterium]
MSISPAIASWQAALATQPQEAARQSAFQSFLARGLPTQRDDAWKYTDLRRIASRAYQLPTPSLEADGTAPLLQGENWHRIVFVDGQLSRDLSTQRSIPGLSIANVFTDDHLKQTPSSFELLNTALGNGTLIEVAANTILEHPIYVAHVWSTKADGWMRHPRTVLRAATNSRVTLIEHFTSASQANNFCNAVTLVDAGDDSQVTHVTLQEDSETNFHIASLQATLARSSHYAHHHYVLGGSLSRTDISIRLQGAYANAELCGLIFARNTQHIDVRTCIEHQVPNTKSNEDYRGIADGRGRAIFNGKVIVSKDAQKTDARQSSRNLLLSSTAEIDTRPELEIYADDVKCAHGATVGQLDAAALFYLRSRGIDTDAARALLTQAFAAVLLERAPVESLRERVNDAIATRLHAQKVVV